MSHFARASIHKAVISYDKKYKTSDFETVTLRQDYADGTNKKKYCLVFTGAEGVEGLLQVKERFDAICEVELNGTEITFNALTCIDPVTNLVEIIRINGKTASHIAQQFENVWLSRYPRPNRCVHDNGGEFIGHEFQTMLQQHGIQDAPTTSRNPQGNSVAERMHQTMANVMRTYLHQSVQNMIDAYLPLDQPQNEIQLTQLIENVLATVTYATRASVSRALNTSPGNLVFNRDMFIDVPLISNLAAIRDRRQQLIDENLIRENKKRREFRYQAGQEVLLKSVDPRKMDPKAHGPYTIQQVYPNGTIDVARNPHVSERINIRRVIPFRRN